jgi:phage baseplate assembly protein W
MVIYNFQNPINPLAPNITDTVPAVVAQQLGSGLALPLSINNNIWQILYGTDKVKQDVYVAVMTPVGRRLVCPSFGSLVPYLMFEFYSPLLRQQIIKTTTDAVNTWVPQVYNVSVQIDETNISNNSIGINIYFSIRGTQAPQSITIPVLLANDPATELPPSNFVVNTRRIFKT